MILPVEHNSSYLGPYSLNWIDNSTGAGGYLYQACKGPRHPSLLGQEQQGKQQRTDQSHQDGLDLIVPFLISRQVTMFDFSFGSCQRSYRNLSNGNSLC